MTNCDRHQLTVFARVTVFALARVLTPDAQTSLCIVKIFEVFDEVIFSILSAISANKCRFALTIVIIFFFSFAILFARVTMRLAIVESSTSWGLP